MTTTTDAKILRFAQLEKKVAVLRAERKRVVLCHGVFDLLHPGHILYFQAAKKFGDILVVTITPDQHVNKGPGRPGFKQGLRLESVAALGAGDFVSLNL